MRKRIDKDSLTTICERLLDVSENYLGLSMKGLSEKLGYKNQSTLTKVKQGKGFIGPDKLKVFGSLTNQKGEHPNIHFVITGEKPVLIGRNEVDIESGEVVALSLLLVEKLGSKKAKDLLSMIVN